MISPLFQSKLMAGLLQVKAENSKILKDMLAFSSFYVHKNRNRFLLTSDFAQISLTVDQLLVNISRAFHASFITSDTLCDK